MTKRTTAGPRLSAKTCKQVSALILDYLNDRLATPVKREFERHLRICPDCVNFLRTYKKTVAVTQVVEAEDLPLNVRANILSFLRKRIRQIGAIVVYCLSQWIA